MAMVYSSDFCLFREFSASCSPASQRLLVFDGPMDMNWVENFNTLLDDNKVCPFSPPTLTPSAGVVPGVRRVPSSLPRTEGRLRGHRPRQGVSRHSVQMWNGAMLAHPLLICPPRFMLVQPASPGTSCSPPGSTRSRRSLGWTVTM